jgi:hypothetical protein
VASSSLSWKDPVFTTTLSRYPRRFPGAVVWQVVQILADTGRGASAARTVADAKARDANRRGFMEAPQ